MAQTPTQGTPQRKRGGGAPSGPRTMYVVLQILDETGNPQMFDKKRVKLLAIDSSADAMLSIAEDENNPNAFFIRGKLAKRGRQQAPTPGQVVGNVVGGSTAHRAA